MIASGSEASYDDGASGEDEDVEKCLGFSTKESSLLTKAEKKPLPRENEGIFTSLCERKMGSEFSAAPSYAVASLRSFTGLIKQSSRRLEITAPHSGIGNGGRPLLLLAPTMPSLAKYVEGAWETPLTAYIPLTKVVGEWPQENPRLEDALAAYLVPGSSSWPSS